MENGRVSGPASFRPLLTPCGLELPVLFFSVFADIPSPGSYGQEPDDPAMIGRRVLAARPLPRSSLVDCAGCKRVRGRGRRGLFDVSERVGSPALPLS